MVKVLITAENFEQILDSLRNRTYADDSCFELEQSINNMIHRLCFGLHCNIMYRPHHPRYTIATKTLNALVRKADVTLMQPILHDTQHVLPTHLDLSVDIMPQTENRREELCILNGYHKMHSRYHADNLSQILPRPQCSVTTLDLSNNYFDTETITVISTALQQNTSVTTLVCKNILVHHSQKDNNLHPLVILLQSNILCLRNNFTLDIRNNGLPTPTALIDACIAAITPSQDQPLTSRLIVDQDCYEAIKQHGMPVASELTAFSSVAHEVGIPTELVQLIARIRSPVSLPLTQPLTHLYAQQHNTAANDTPSNVPAVSSCSFTH